MLFFFKLVWKVRSLSAFFFLTCSRWKYERSGSSDDQGSTILWYPLINWSTIKRVKMHVIGVNSLKLNNIPALSRIKLGLCNVAFLRSARKTSSMCCLQLLQKHKYSLTSLYRQICIARCVLLVSVAKRFDYAYLGKNVKSRIVIANSRIIEYW